MATDIATIDGGAYLEFFQDNAGTFTVAGGGGGGPTNPDGDYNDDGIVDIADYTVWRNSLGSTTSLDNDNGLGTPVGNAHYDLWKNNFGDSAGGSLITSVVPEPSSIAMLVSIAGIALLRRR